MPKRYSSWELIKMVQDDGWYFIAAAGSHHHFRHPTKPGKVTITHPKKDMPIKTAYSVLRQAGLR